MPDWFYKHGNKSIGPIDEDTMRAWIKDGSIKPSQLIRNDSSPEWQPAETCFTNLVPKSIAPDFLADIVRPYFECEGLCFFPLLDSANGLCRVNLFYQNRFSGPCHADITLWPVPGFCQLNPRKNSLSISLSCAGGEFGVVRHLYNIDPKKQGKRTDFHLEGQSTYPDGKGQTLRLEQGFSANRRRSSDTFVQILIGVVTLGHLIIHHNPAKISLVVPKDITSQAPLDSPPEKAILWSLDQLTPQPT